jgi:hypothetical protein
MFDEKTTSVYHTEQYSTISFSVLWYVFSTTTLLLALYFPYLFLITSLKHGGFFGLFYVLYSTLLHLPPLRFHCVTSLTSVSFTVFSFSQCSHFFASSFSFFLFSLSLYLLPHIFALIIAHLKIILSSFSSLLFAETKFLDIDLTKDSSLLFHAIHSLSTGGF